MYDFGTEMQTFLEILEELKEHTESNKTRSWNWLFFWRGWTSRWTGSQDPEITPLVPSSQGSAVRDVTDLTRERRDAKKWNTPVREKRIKEGLYRRILQGLRVLERDDGK